MKLSFFRQARQIVLYFVFSNFDRLQATQFRDLCRELGEGKRATFECQMISQWDSTGWMSAQNEVRGWSQRNPSNFAFGV